MLLAVSFAAVVAASGAAGLDSSSTSGASQLQEASWRKQLGINGMQASVFSKI